MTKMLHIYRPRRFQWTWLGLNRPSEDWISASARFQELLSCPCARPLCPMCKWSWRCTSTGQDGSNELDLERIGPLVAEFQGPQDSCSPYQAMGTPIMPPWTNNHGVAHLQARTVPKNLIWSESAQWLLSSGVRKISKTLITDSKSPYYAHGHAHVAPMGKWLWRRTSICWGSSNELDLEWISPVVAELWGGRTGGRAGGRRPFHRPLFSPSERVGDKNPVLRKYTYTTLKKIIWSLIYYMFNYKCQKCTTQFRARVMIVTLLW